jgi:hypothetical protein
MMIRIASAAPAGSAHFGRFESENPVEGATVEGARNASGVNTFGSFSSTRNLLVTAPSERYIILSSWLFKVLFLEVFQKQQEPDAANDDRNDRNGSRSTLRPCLGFS